MLDPSTLADIEGDADALRRVAGVDGDEVPHLGAMCAALTGSPPIIAEQRARSLIDERDRVVLRRGLPVAIARYLVGHELAELHYRRLRYEGEDIEARCDALGAALVAPWRVARAAIREHGHHVCAVASALRVPQALALLRIGEVTGRPVLLLRRPPIARGAAYVWPAPGQAPRGVAHPVRLADEGRWGLMTARDV